MLISFVGAPASGKTTIAASVFAVLKQSGIPAEFIAEKAREYIVEKKFVDHMKGKEFALTDEDQIQIMKSQWFAEVTYAHNNSSPVICDSSTILTMLYFSESVTPEIQAEAEDLAKISASYLEYVFYCSPKNNVGKDSNRVHDKDFSLQIDKKIVPLFKTLAPNAKMVILEGDVQTCVREVINTLYPNGETLG